MELAEKQLQKIRFLSSFIQLHTLQKSIGTHTVPVDDRIHDTAIWLGLAAPGSSPAEVADGLKSAVMKADTATFCDYVRCFATDPRLIPTFAKTKPPEDGFDLDEMLARATDLLNNADKAHKAHKAKPESPAAKSKPAAKAPPKAKAGPVKKKPR